MTALDQSLGFFSRHAGIVLVAPAFYWLAGFWLGWATGKVEWSILWGIGLVGLAAEMGAIAGAPATAAAMAAAGAGLVGAVFLLGSGVAGRAGIDWFGELRRHAESYLISLLAVAAVPFALPGAWGGDWLAALDSGRYLAEGRSFDSTLLARPPLFGAASIPLCQFGDPLASFQIFCAVGSAAMLQVARTFIAPAGHPRLLWLFGGSIFFLHLTANAWPKFLAAAFVLAAWICSGEKGRRRIWGTGGLLGLALATHQSSVLFVPVVLVRLLGGKQTFRQAVTETAGVLAAAAAVCLPWETYTLAAYGLAAKVQANPVVSQRLASVPAGLNALLVGVSTFVAWGPVAEFRHWMSVDAPVSAARLQKEFFWFVTSGFNSLAGSLAGVLVPWLAALPWKSLRAGLVEFGNALPGAAWLALAFSLAGQCLLNPYYSAEGSLQTGWVPVGVGLLCWLMLWVSRRPRIEQATVIRCTCLLGLAPWTAFHFLLTVGLFFSPRFQGQFIASGDDLQLIRKAALTPLGLGAFPWIQTAILLGLILLYGRREAATPC